MKFSQLSTYIASIEKTPLRNEMTRILSELFLKANVNEISDLCYLLQGRVTPIYEPLEFGMADKFIIRAISLAYDVPTESVLREFKQKGDLGTVSESLYNGKDANLSVAKVYAALRKVAECQGAGSQEQKIMYLAALLRDVDNLSARYIARIPLDKLRLGFSDVTIIDALSTMLVGDKSLREKIESSFNVYPDMGFIAVELKKNGVKGLTHVKAKVGAPILSALCSRLPTADEMIEKMHTVSVEPKYDGVRVQIHYQRHGGSLKTAMVKSYSRNLEPTTGMFPELLGIGDQLTGNDVILDAEAVGMDPKTGARLSFQDTITRKRKHGIAKAQSQIPLVFFVFDILYRDGKDLLSQRLDDRRKILEQTVKKGKVLIISPHIVTDDPNMLRSYHDAQIKDGLEGVVVKKVDSPYETGRKGFSWVKFKEEEGKTGKLTDTIDAVVMGYYKGEGKRSSFGIGAFLVGIKQKDTIVTLTKIGTGVTDEKWGILKRLFTPIEVAQKPKEYGEVHDILIPDVWVSPEVVVEIAGDDLTRSPFHSAKYAVRFPRLVGVREDKGVANATTTKEVASMYAMQKSTHKE